MAMGKEFVQLKSLLADCRTERYRTKDFVIGTLGSHELILQQCGIGKVNSTIGATELIAGYAPDVIVSTGVAGGADASLNPLDVVVGTTYAYHDVYCGTECSFGQVQGMPTRFKADNALVEKALALNAGKEKEIVRAGLIVTGDWFVDSREKMTDILEHFPQALAVDMESCSIAHTCHLYKIPFVSFRIISDVPLKDHEASQYFDFWNRMAEGSFNVTKAFLLNV